MKIYICCDLEGTAGVVDHRKQCWFDGEYYAQARRLATLELNAAVEGALEGGATEIYAWDGHGNFPGGLDIELLHPACKMVICAGDGGPEGLDSSFDGLFLIGIHGMAGAKKGVLSHSFMPHIQEMTVNGRPWGEIAMNFFAAGMQKVPSIFVAGDWAAAQEADSLVPGIETAVVKWGLVETGSLRPAPAVSLAPEKACEVIREGACKAMQKTGQMDPFYFPGPYTVRSRFTESKHADRIASTYSEVKRIDELTVEKIFPSWVEPLV